jgi:selenocysteine lyase/cysteine desulfurase
MGEAEAKPDDIRVRVHTGTRDLAAILTVPAAIDFHQTIGTGRVRERLKHLRDRWAEVLRDHPGYEVLTPADPRLSAGLTSFRRRGRTSAGDNAALARTLLDDHGIFTVVRTGLGSGACVRVTPALFTQSADIDRLLVALKRIAAV